MKRPLLAYFGHHKCASQWVSAILRSICKATARRHEIVYGMDEENGDLGRHLRARRIDFLLYANVIPEHVETLSDFRGVHVVRDPRDVIVSGYFSHLKTHTTNAWSELIPHRERLQQASKEEGLLLEMEFSGYHLDRMQRWDYGRDHILELRLEDIIGREFETFVEIAGFFDLLDEPEPSAMRRLAARATELTNRVWAKTGGLSLAHRRCRIDRDGLRRIVDANAFSRKAAGRRPGEEDTNSHYRKGTPGDWRNHFGPEHVQAFKERWGELVLRLGYERTRDW